MMLSFKNAFASTAMVLVSLTLWHIAYQISDLAVLALIPMGSVIYVGAWSLFLEPWRAKLGVALREDSPLRQGLTGKLRATLLSLIFTFTAVTLLAWFAHDASRQDMIILTCAFVLAAAIYTQVQACLLRHFHEPFARPIAMSLVTWIVGLPFTIILAYSTWTSKKQPGRLLEADFLQAVATGLDELPERGGWIATIFSVPYGYEAARLWIVVQLRDYPIVGSLFCLDAALIVFVLCRTAIMIAQFTDRHLWR